VLHAFGRELRLVSFDLDDTLVDTLASVPPRVRATLLAMNHRFARPLPEAEIDEVARVVVVGDPDGRPARLLTALQLAQDDPVALELIEAYAANDHFIEAAEGAERVLAALSERTSVVVITNGVTRIQAGKVRRNGLDRYLTALVCSEDIGMRKPDAGAFLHACTLTDIPPEAAVHIGDSVATDVLGARNAGFASILLRTQVPWPTMEHPQRRMPRSNDSMSCCPCSASTEQQAPGATQRLAIGAPAAVLSERSAISAPWPSRTDHLPTTCDTRSGGREAA
jgi:putative hydrolase of the HAD superfamily